MTKVVLSMNSIIGHWMRTLIMMFWFTGCATYEPTKVSLAESLPKNYTVAEDVVMHTLPQLRRDTEKIYVEYKDSAELTQTLQQALTAKGFQVARTLAEATAILKVNGLYNISGPKHNGSLAVAQLVGADGVIRAEQTDGNVRVAPLQGIAYAAAFSRFAKFGLITSTTANIASIGAIAEASGAAGTINKSINKAITGEETPCLIGKCEELKKHQQKISTYVNVTASGKNYGAVLRTRIAAVEPDPGVLVQHSLNVLLAEVTGGDK